MMLLVRSAMPILTLIAFSYNASAKNCGGNVPCVCGDRVTSSYKLTGDLVCNGNVGLTIAGNGVYLDGLTPDNKTYTISRAQRPTNKDVYGILIADGTHSAIIANVTITGFARGIHIQNSKNNLIVKTALVDNGYDRDASGKVIKPAGYGIDLAKGASNNYIVNNLIQNNFDEGIHLGTGSAGTGNLIQANIFANNGEENIYILDSPQTKIIDNHVSGARQNSMYIKHSSDCIISKNHIFNKPIALEGNSDRNKLTDNTISGAAIILATNGGLYPDNNVLSGGTYTPFSNCTLIKQRFDKFGHGNRYEHLPCQ
ncbi:MAG: right-handed parallel beta-helix repeat-containing protein [Pseudomonadota bacterium]|nr:right-handed parallel beta-helix repeat-containing protein [Pseudomonadota bacterium]